jgi:hypothetical protein
MLEYLSAPVLFGQSPAALVLFVGAAFVGWMFYVASWRKTKPVVFHVCRTSPSGVVEQRYTYWQGGKSALKFASLAEIPSEVRKATNALLASKENPPPFIIRFEHPAGYAHVERRSRTHRAVLCEALSDAERGMFWSDYTATQLSVAV